ncbi:MAG: hypothetical protein M0T84_00195 [Betaproteobacteria bacterium]|nr:hypothetical protein [Betaproteobacteria bacterium]
MSTGVTGEIMASDGIGRDLKHRIRARAHVLAQQRYEELVAAMLRDDRVTSGIVRPEDWSDAVESNDEFISSMTESWKA